MLLLVPVLLLALVLLLVPVLAPMLVELGLDYFPFFLSPICNLYNYV